MPSAPIAVRRCSELTEASYGTGEHDRGYDEADDYRASVELHRAESTARLTSNLPVAPPVPPSPLASAAPAAGSRDLAWRPPEVKALGWQ
jgi:hypothetical protein